MTRRACLTILASVLVLGLSACVGVKPADADSGYVNALAPKGPRVMFHLAEKQKALAVIVLPSSPTSQETKAAEILKTGLDAMSGAAFPVVKETRIPAGSGVLLSIGDTNLWKRRQFTPTALGPDGYALQAAEDTLFFTGGERRGPINAVIAFLEEDMGCRWYSQFVPAYYPKREELKAAVVPRTFSPTLEMRDVYQAETWDWRWSVMNRASSAINPLSLEIPAAYGGAARYPGSQLFAHTFSTLAPDAALLASHPEYFALIDGKRQTGNLCLSNPEAVKIAAQKAVKILDAFPGSSFFSVSQNDGREVLCRCQQCLALSKKENDSGLLLNFVNQTAALIHQKHPQVKVTTLAYMQTFMPPKTIRPGKDVLIWLATDTHIWSNPYLFITETERFKAALAAWRAINVPIHIWDYTFADNANWLNPAPNFEVIDANFRYLSANGVSGIFFQDNYMSVGGSRAAMKDWVLLKMAWNPAWRMQDLLRDFTFGYYGAAAPAMWQYNQLLQRLWEQYHQTRQTAALRLDNEFVRRASELIQQAKTAVAADPVVSREVEREEACLLYARLDNGMTSLDDKTAYLRDMDKLRQYLKEFKITSFAETTGNSINAKFDSWKLAVDIYERREAKSSPGSLGLSMDKVYLPSCGPATCRLVKEPASNSGYAVYQPCPVTNWSIQWSGRDAGDYRLDQRYVLRLKIKLGEASAAGDVLHCGIWADSATLLARNVKASELSTNAFTWVTIGVTRLPSHSNWTLYAGPVDNSAAKSFLLECGELIPENEFNKQ